MKLFLNTISFKSKSKRDSIPLILAFPTFPLSLFTLPSGKTLKGKQRNKFEVNKIKIDVLKSELIAGLN